MKFKQLGNTSCKIPVIGQGMATEIGCIREYNLDVDSITKTILSWK